MTMERALPLLYAFLGVLLWFHATTLIDERLWPWALTTLLGCACAWRGIHLEKKRRERIRDE